MCDRQRHTAVTPLHIIHYTWHTCTSHAYTAFPLVHAPSFVSQTYQNSAMTRSPEQAFLLSQAVQTFPPLKARLGAFCLSRGTWLLLKATLLTTDLYFRETETEWERETRVCEYV